MIAQELMCKIGDRAQRYWDEEISKPYFKEMASGKEIGHRIADLVDEKATALLTVHYLTRFQRSSTGSRLPRSMGDVWLESGGICHPINVKTCVTGGTGQPNMVSLRKVLSGLLLRRIDSYYLLMVKLEDESNACTVFFVDMLEYLDYVTYDAGPGQIMLKATAFFQAMDGGVAPAGWSTGHKVEHLMALLEDGVARLIVNRERSLEDYRRRVQAYLESGPHEVTPQTQEALRLR